MKGQILSMSMKERERLKVFSRVEAGELKLVEAAGVLGMSYRQSQRMMARYKEEGDGGIVHRSRGGRRIEELGKSGGRQCWGGIRSGTGISGRHWRRRSFWWRDSMWITRRCGGG